MVLYLSDAMTTSAHLAHQQPIRLPMGDQQVLDGLATNLIARHIRNSLPTSRMRDAIFEELGRRANTAPRIVFVVGAGASASKFWRADQLATQLVDELETSRDGYEAELRRLQRAFNLDPHAFETKLAALARTEHAESLVRARIQSYYGRRHPTLLVYELIAHLLKHRFADGVISFNFDELLDQSVCDEVGNAEYVSVISERDVVIRPEFKPQSPRYKPFLIKPHGTASDPSSLRFTRGSYHALPQPIAEVIHNLMGTEWCVLISVGFGLASFDFLEMLDRPTRLTIYNLSWAQLHPTIEERIDLLRRNAGHRPESLKVFDLPQGSIPPSEPRWRMPEDLSPADAALAVLVQCIETQIDRAQRRSLLAFRDHARHGAVVRLLGEQDLADRERYGLTLASRAVLEMSFSLVRSRGVASVASLAEERGSSYYDMARGAGLELQWPTICHRGGLVKSGISNETYLPIPELDSAPQDPPSLSTAVHRAVKFRQLAEHVLQYLPATPYSDADVSYLQAIYERLSTGTEIEVRGFSDQICSRIFSQPQICTTLTALRARTYYMLTETRYDQLAVAAETGEWLLDEVFAAAICEAIRSRGARVIVMVAFKTMKDQLIARFGQEALRVVYAPWWRNNRRMTLVGSGDVALEATYFARRLRSAFVSPVCLMGNDAGLAWKNFSLSCRAAACPGTIVDSSLDFSALWNMLGYGTGRRA